MIGKIYRDVRLWLYIRKMKKTHKHTADWIRFNLRVDWVGRIYTVLNPELPTDKGDSKEILKYKYTERVRPINMYINSLGLAPYVTFRWLEIPESDSYLIAYVPMYEILTFWRIIWSIVLLTASIVTYVILF